MEARWVEHVAVRVIDFDWHVHFFRDIMRLPYTEELVDDQGVVQQIWLGGMQIQRAEDFEAAPPSQQRLSHVGILVDDREATLARALAIEGVELFEDKEDWFILPEGLVVELVKPN